MYLYAVDDKRRNRNTVWSGLTDMLPSDNYTLPYYDLFDTLKKKKCTTVYCVLYRHRYILKITQISLLTSYQTQTNNSLFSVAVFSFKFSFYVFFESNERNIILISYFLLLLTVWEVEREGEKERDSHQNLFLIDGIGKSDILQHI